MTQKEKDQKKLEASQTIMRFMWSLTRRYSAEDIRTLTRAEQAMEDRYGIVFLADAIRKDPQGAELALFRYAKKLPAPEPEPEQYTTIDAPKAKQYRTKRYGSYLTGIKDFLSAGAVFVILLVALAIL